MMSILDDSTPVFYVPGRPGIIDLAVLRDGEQVGGYSGETLPQIALRYPGVQLGELGPVSAASDESWKSPPVEITADRYMEMLEVLPPVAWKSSRDAETFKLSERTSGNITAIFCRLGERYFEMQDSIFLKHDAIVDACKATA